MSPHEPDRAVAPSEVLASLGLGLPSVSPPKGRYVPAVVSGRFVFVAGQMPLEDGRLVATGHVGGEVTVALAREPSRRLALASPAAVDVVAGVDRVTRIVKVTGDVAVAPRFRDLDAAVDGAGARYEAVFGARGAQARAVAGVADLPLDTPVEIETLVEIDR